MQIIPQDLQQFVGLLTSLSLGNSSLERLGLWGFTLLPPPMLFASAITKLVEVDLSASLYSPSPLLPALLERRETYPSSTSS